MKNKPYILGLSVCAVIIGIVALRLWLRPPRPLPNIVLITVDALRADRLGCYGYVRDTSPFLDRLSKESVLFQEAIAVSSHTPPSMMTMATGLYPHQHGVLTWGYVLKKRLTLPVVLNRMGYYTVFLGGNGNFKKGLPGFSDGFRDFFELTHSQQLTEKAVNIVNATAGPFFMWIHYMNTHAFYEPLYGDEIPFLQDALYDSGNSLPAVEPLHYYYGYKGISKQFTRHYRDNCNPDYYRALYDGAVRTVDRHIQDVVAALKNKKIFENTLLIVTADHGEMMGEHDLYFHHGSYLYEPLIDVPLIIKPAGPIRGTVVTDQVAAHLDLAPTILSCVHKRPYSWMRGEILIPRPARVSRGRMVFSDEGALVYSVRTPFWKLICTRKSALDQQYELYHIKKDPQEAVDVRGRYPEIFRAFKEHLDRFIRETQRESAHGFGARQGVLDAQTRDSLRSLGYMH